MIVIQFQGHTLSNSNRAIAIEYPAITGGRDIIEDAAKMQKKLDTGTLLFMYVAYRRAGDPEARKLSVDEVMDEVDVYNVDIFTEFVQAITTLWGEKSKKD